MGVWSLKGPFGLWGEHPAGVELLWTWWKTFTGLFPRHRWPPADRPQPGSERTRAGQSAEPAPEPAPGSPDHGSASPVCPCSQRCPSERSRSVSG